MHDFFFAPEKYSGSVANKTQKWRAERLFKTRGVGGGQIVRNYRNLCLFYSTHSAPQKCS